MRIYLVRHGQSKANLDWSENTHNADHTIPLTDEGHKQAKAAGEYLAGCFERNYLLNSFTTNPKIRLWHSPYLRTRQTAQGIWDNCKIERSGEDWLYDKREHLLLAEQQFGLFDGLSDEERKAKYPDMVAHYEKNRDAGGKMWPKMPMGESRFEVCQRVHQAFGTFQRDCDKHGIDTIVVVGHGTTNRAFLTMWLHHPFEWMHEEPNPKNCSIRLINDGKDHGYIFEGF